MMTSRRGTRLVRTERGGRPRARHVSVDRRDRLLVAALTMLLTFLGLCLPSVALAQHFSFRQYTQSDGLTNLAIGHLLQSRDADLWIGTDSGLFRFDGAGFVAYDRSHGLLKEAVRGVAEDPYGRMWVMLDRGLFNGGKANFQSVGTDDGAIVPDAGMPLVFLGPDRLLTTVRKQIVDLRGLRNGNHVVWRSTALFTPAQLSAHPALRDVRAMIAAPDGTVWLGCGRGLCSLSTSGLRTFGPADGVPESDWSTLATDREGRFWARSAAHLVVHDGGTAGFVPRDPPNAELKSGLTTPVLALDGQGRMLTRTALGLARWNGLDWTEFTPANGLPGTVITSVRTDADGDLWLSVFGQGLWHWLGYGHLESWGRAEGIGSDSVWAILRDTSGRLLFGTDHGCEWLDEAAHRAHPCPVRGLPDMQALTLSMGPDGGLWFGFGAGAIWTVPPGRHDAFAVGSVGLRGTVAQIAFDDPAQAWIGGNANGLHRLDTATGHLTPVPLPGDPGRVWESVALTTSPATTGTAPGSANAAEPMPGAIPPIDRCVATSQGLYRVSRGRGRRIDMQHDGAEAGFLSMARQSDGSIWATSTSQGILHAPGCASQGAEWVAADIVSKAHAYVIRIDGRGWVWAGTDQGVVVFDGHLWQRLDVSDGLVWNDTNENAFWADADGSVWIGTSAGMTHVIDPAGLFAARRKPLDLQIANASFGERALRPGSTTAVAAGSAPHAAQQVPWQADDSFDVRLASHTHGRSARTQFEYRLLGMSPKWLGSQLPEVHLPALEPGSYRFEARAIDADHGQRSAVVAMDFEVVPPWWRSTAFRVSTGALTSLLVAGLVVVAWRAKVARLHARRLALEAQYQEREALLQRATRDDLTGLWNRLTILEILTREIAQAQRTREPLAIALLDVDHFKRINDTLGHRSGDDVLRELSLRIDAALRQSDWIGRYGGEELLVVMPGLPQDGAAAPVERLRECVAERRFESQGASIEVTLSVGLAWFRPDVDHPDDLIARADAALYAAKRSGRNRVMHATEAQPDRPAQGSELVA